MGQGSSKETKPEKAEEGMTRPQTQASSASPAVEATPSSFKDGSSPSLSHKLLNYFSPKSDNLSPKVFPGHVKCSSASPLPPSSSLLAQGFREELGGISPAQYKRVNSSFFLGKVLISPRRPLREGSQSSQSLGNSASKNASYEYGTPKSLKRKASPENPENTSYSKKRKQDDTASPSLKRDWRLLTMKAQVEEQDEEDENGPIELNNKVALGSSRTSTNAEFKENCAVEEASNFDARELTTESEIRGECERGNTIFNDEEIENEESRLSAPYSPSQPTRNLLSAMNFSLSSSATCASPAPAYVPHNSTIEELDEDAADDADAEQREEDEGNVTLSQTIGKGLQLLKETLLGTDRPSVNEESDDEQKSEEESAVFDSCEVTNEDNPHSERLSDNPQTTTNSEAFGNGNTECEEHEEERSCSKTQSHASNEEYDLGINNHPRAGTTHSSTDSKKMLKSEYMVTESKVPQKETTKEKDDSNKKDGDNSSPAKATLRSPSSEDSFYHHPLSRSTFSSSISKGKWPSFSLISTSSVSAIPVASFQFFKSIMTSENLPVSSSNGNAEASSVAPDTCASTDDVLTDTAQSNKDNSLCSLNNPPESQTVEPSADASLNQTIKNGTGNESLDLNEGCEIASSPDDSNKELSETVVNSEIEKTCKGNQTPPENNIKSSYAVTPMTKQVSPQLVTPKRSSRIASIRSSQKAVESNSPKDSQNGTPSNSSRQRRRRSSSSESGASLHTSRGSQADDSATSRSAAKKQRMGKSLAPHESTDISTNDHVEQDGEASEKSPTAKPDSFPVHGKFEDVALLRDNASALHARSNQLLIVVVRSSNNSSSALIRELRLQFPLGSFISAAAAKHGKKSRRAASHGPGLKLLERNVMQQVSPIIVEAAGGASVKPHLLIAHSANYNSVVLPEAAFSSMLPYQPAPASLPFCYSWFLSLTDSVELSTTAQQLLRRLLAVPAIRRDLLLRTKHSSTQEFTDSYIRNNTVGGPEILHCTAKGGTSASDAAYTARRDVRRALGQVSTLQVVGFVITPRTFGARVKLDADQLTLWDNSDSPTVPRAIASMFEEQQTHVSVGDDQTLALDSDTDDDAADDLNEILGYNADKKSLVFIPGRMAGKEKFCPTSGLGSRAHITLGCHTKNVHPRTTGFDLLLALQMEKDFHAKKYPNGVMEDSSNVDIPDLMEDQRDEESAPASLNAEGENEAVDAETVKNGAAQDELPGDLTMSDIEEVMSTSIEDTPEVKNLSEPFSDSKAVAAPDSITINVEGAVVRGYGEGVWVVYPDRYINVSAMFAGFHNAE